MKFKPYFFAFTITTFLIVSVSAQSTDLFRLEYSHIPKNNSGITTRKFRALANYPIKLKEEKYLFIGGEYNRFTSDFDKQLPFETGNLEKFYVIDMNVGYLTKWNENWRIVSILTPRLASNFTNGIISDDFFFNATVTMWKEVSDIDKPYRLLLGLSYNSTTGLPIPLPLVSYYRRYHPKWSFTLGTSKSNFKYHGRNNSLEMALLLDGYFINIQDDIILPDTQLGSRVSLSALILGLGYQHDVTDGLKLYVIGGSTILQGGRLRDDQRNDTFLLNNESNLYFRTGIKFSLF